ncbi:MAG: C2 family cysteine protease [Elusimicrobia bacterium]|nr:C2 family cysteine protease [Elusimicrobiota bacterium]
MTISRAAFLAFAVVFAAAARGADPARAADPDAESSAAGPAIQGRAAAPKDVGVPPAFQSPAGGKDCASRQAGFLARVKYEKAKSAWNADRIGAIGESYGIGACKAVTAASEASCRKAFDDLYDKDCAGTGDADCQAAKAEKSEADYLDDQTAKFRQDLRSRVKQARALEDCKPGAAEGQAASEPAVTATPAAASYRAAAPAAPAASAPRAAQPASPAASPSNAAVASAAAPVVTPAPAPALAAAPQTAPQPQAGIFDGLVDGLKKVGGAIVDGGKAVVNGVTQGVKTVINTGSTVVHAVVTTVKQQFLPPKDKNKPDFNGLGCRFLIFGCSGVPGAKYQKLTGILFEKGPGDASDISPKDINQGQIGDCYFMSSLASVASKDPGVIRGMFQANKDGTYSVTFYKNPWWDPLGVFGKHKKTVKVDNQFPVLGGSPAMAGYGDGVPQPELWPMVAEKGYAEISRNDSYNAIGNGGSPGSALTAITGNNSNAHLAMFTSINDLASWDAQHHAIVAGTKPDILATDPLYKNSTVYPGHAYWVVGIDKANKTVTLANPWGWDYQHVTLTEDQFKNIYLTVYDAYVP